MLKDSRPKSVDERWNVFMPAESAKRLLRFQETRRCPAHGHGDIAVVCDSATHTSDHRVRGLDHVGGGQAARQLSGHTKSVEF